MSSNIDKYALKAKVEIMGREYSLKGDVDPEYMILLSKYVDDKIKELKSSLREADITKLVLLTSLNIADELFEARKQASGVSALPPRQLDQLGTKADELLSLLETGLIGEN